MIFLKINHLFKYNEWFALKFISFLCKKNKSKISFYTLSRYRNFYNAWYGGIKMFVKFFIFSKGCWKKLFWSFSTSYTIIKIVFYNCHCENEIHKNIFFLLFLSKICKSSSFFFILLINNNVWALFFLLLFPRLNIL